MQHVFMLEKNFNDFFGLNKGNSYLYFSSLHFLHHCYDGEVC